MKREKSLLDHPWINQRRVFTTQEAGKALGWSDADLHATIFRLVEKGRLIRIKRGLFCLVPPGSSRFKKGYPQNWFLIAKALTEGESYYVSYYSAMHLHGMTSQSIQTIFVTLPKQRRVPANLQIPIRFVTVSREKLWGLEDKWVSNEEKVSISNLERTVLDILDRPDLAGGISEIARGLWLVKKNIDMLRLVSYATRFDSVAAVKRLGFLMEQLRLGPREIGEQLKKIVENSKSFALLDPTSGNQGPYLGKWHLRINVEMAQILDNLVT